MNLKILYPLFTTFLLTYLSFCRYENLAYNSAIAINFTELIIQNTKIWKICEKIGTRACGEPSFLEEACSRFPRVVTKVVRLRLNVTRILLEDPQFNHLKIIYLVRDPRGSINSRIRSHLACKSCQDPVKTCMNLKKDLDAFDLLSKEFPERLLLIKYESIAEQPHETFQQVFEFADLPVFSSIMQEITDHTTQNQDGVSNTHRKSSERIDLWKKKLSKRMIYTIQNYCSSVFKRLGYLRM